MASTVAGYGAALLATKHSQLAGALIGDQSVYTPRGWQALTATHQDPTVAISTLDGSQGRFGGQIRFALPKNSTLIGNLHWELVLSRGITRQPYTDQAARIRCEYVKNVGDLLLDNVVFRYGNNILQNWTGEFQALWRRLSVHDVNLEGTNANVLGGLPPGGVTELVLEDACTVQVASGGGAGPFALPAVTNITLNIPIEEWFATAGGNRDTLWFPESLALEGELLINLPTLARICVSTAGADPFSGVVALAAGVPAVYPTVVSSRLRYEEITLTAAEKENRLRLYSTPEGCVQHFLDLERQPSFTLASVNVLNTALQAVVALDAFRMDMAEIIFCVRRSTGTIGVDVDWAGSPLESSTAVSNITGASIACMVPITDFRLTAGGKDVFVAQPDQFNRTVVRKRYHPDSQIADPIYVIPLALFPEDRKNATGHQSASALGPLKLIINFPDVAFVGNYRVDVWAHSHNIMQSRQGGITKAQH